METVFEKLNLKDQKQIVVLNSPGSFESELAAFERCRRHSRSEESETGDVFPGVRYCAGTDRCSGPGDCRQSGRRRHRMVRLSQGDLEELQVADRQGPRLDRARS